jgi:hypothetical protein
VHGRNPRGSRPWEERPGQHPDRCNSRGLPCYRICSVLTRNAVFITKSTFCRGGGATRSVPGSRRQRESNARPRRNRRAPIRLTGLPAAGRRPTAWREAQSIYRFGGKLPLCCERIERADCPPQRSIRLLCRGAYPQAQGPGLRLRTPKVLTHSLLAHLKLVRFPVRSPLPSRLCLLSRFFKELRSTSRFAHLCRSSPLGSIREEASRLYNDLPSIAATMC